MADESAPKLHIDSDWKAEAQREKARLSEKEKPKAPTPAAGGKKKPLEEGELPEASFKSLVGMLASQAIMGLGEIGRAHV